ncbi:eukaryotic and archaeal DNA primase, large subunit-domain-containing protein [Phakopsora pachyrhizi]|uniref:DNA primase large subunit n=1 Tax=Phakopsora pachyrhizi TaxID=170000 RepID=A0AAV0BLS2_PHAPC|nr:eukaryotic and archaeal DNA primase, large subunit-domain-containing protein [Phakopsora pachyrhizi]CAH7687685.1 eukaryotic and archaeal DNA primase, large subunit-domain-containing protein [Phakopsora pachyrhizi]
MFATQQLPGGPFADNTSKVLNSSSKFLSAYSEPPNSDITIEEFEGWAIDRLKVLAEIENAVTRNRSFEDLKPILTNRCREFFTLPPGSQQLDGISFLKKKDQYSHFILRLAFCRSEELRRRFVYAETQLLKFRLDGASPTEQQELIRCLNIDWELVSISKPGSEAKNAFLYRVHWTKVTDLVSARKVELLDGYATINTADQVYVILQEFSSKLTKALEVTAKHLPYLDEDSRLLPVLEHLSINFLAGISGPEFVSSNIEHPDGTHFTADMVDELAKKHFPPCMRHLWMILRKDKHLKYGGRQQLNLFLKGIGLPVEEALIFWRKAFCNISEDKFRKDYRYGVRHNYGLEGSRKNYQPKPCTAIIKDSVGPQDCHGCPFKQFSSTNLTHYLAQVYGMDPNSNEMKDIINWTKTQHYHLACSTVFEQSHKSFGIKKGDGLGGRETVDHPNKYFEASFKLSQATQS